MVTQVSIGYGSTFAISTDGGNVYIPLAEVLDVTPPSDSIDIIDATNMDSPDATREYILGLNDPGECSLEMNFIPGSAADQKIQAVRAARQAVYCRITYPNAVTWTFLGILTGYEPAVPTGDKMSATVTFKVTGSYVDAPAAAPVNSVLPAISGIAQVGHVLTLWAGTWSGAPVFTYVWKKSGAPINGATNSTYTPVVGDVGAPITVTVTGTNAAGNSSATSIATANVIPA
jgi:hypothetical protein